MESRKVCTFIDYIVVILFPFFKGGRITSRMYELCNLVRNQIVYHLQQMVSLFISKYFFRAHYVVELVACPRTARWVKSPPFELRIIYLSIFVQTLGKLIMRIRDQCD